MSIKPLHDRVVVKPIEADEISAGGILIPDSAKEKSTKGEVVAVGPGKPLDNGSVRAPALKVGDKVKWASQAGGVWTDKEGVVVAVIAGGLDGVAVGAGVALHPASRAGTASSMASGRRTNGMPGAYLRSSPSTCCPVG